MSVIKTIYQGNYQCATQSPLNAEPIITKAVRFTPIDLLVSAYGSCLLATIDYEARKNQFQTSDLRSEISYKMSEDTSQLGAVQIKIFLGSDYTNEQKQIIEFASQNYCHVGKSLNLEVKKEFEFIYNELK